MKNDIFWNSLGTAAWSFLSLFLLVIVTRVNGIADSGLFSFAFALAIILYTVACYGGRMYQISDHRSLFTSDAYISLRILTSFAAVFIAALFVLLNGYGFEKALLILLLVGQRIFDALADVLYGLMQKNNRLYISGKSLFYKSTLSLLVFALIDVATGSLLLSSLSLPVISLLFIVFYDIPQSRKVEQYSIKLQLSTSNAILKSNFMPFSITVMGLIFANLARYFMDIYRPDLQGYFGIIIMPLSLVILLFSFLLVPSMLQLSDKYNNRDIDALHKIVRNIVSLVLTATTLLCIATYVFGPPVLKWLFNIDFTEYILDLLFVILIGCALSITSLFTNVAIIARKLHFATIVYLFSNILLGILCIILVQQIQIRGAILAYMIASVAQTIVMGIYYLKFTGRQRLSKNS